MRCIALQDDDDDHLARLRKNECGIALSEKGIANYVISINRKSREVAKFASCCVSLDHWWLALSHPLVSHFVPTNIINLMHIHKQCIH